MEKWFAVGGNGDIESFCMMIVFWSPVLFHLRWVQVDSNVFICGNMVSGGCQKEGDEGLSGSFKYTECLMAIMRSLN